MSIVVIHRDEVGSIEEVGRLKRNTNSASVAHDDALILRRHAATRAAAIHRVGPAVNRRRAQVAPRADSQETRSKAPIGATLGDDMFGNVHNANYYDNRNIVARQNITKVVDVRPRSSDHNYEMRNKWLKDRLKELRKTQSALATQMGLPTPRISEIIAGDRRIASHEVPVIAAFLEWPESLVLQNITEVAGGAFTPNAEATDMQMLAVTVVGEVAAGVFRESLELPPEDQFQIYALLDPRFRGMPHFGLRVRGPSMNQLYPEGSFVVCVPLIHLGEGFMPKSGNRVVVERRNKLGEVEATIKEMVYDKDGQPWLWPRSDHPEFQTPWPLPTGNNGHGLDDHEDIRISALVVFSVRPEV